MGFLQRLFGVEKRSEDTEIGGMISADEVITSLIGGGEQITEKTAMEIPAFSAAVDFVAGTIAMLPIKLCDDNAKEQSTSENADDYRLSLLNDETGDLLSSYGAKYAQIRDMLCGGAGYMYINRNGSQIKSLHYVSRADISVIKSYDPIFKTADIMVEGKRYSPFDFVILARKSADGVTGTGIVEEHKTILSAMYNALKYENVVSKTGGNKKGFLTSESKLTDEAMRELRRTWQEVYANNESRAMVLNKGINFIPSGATAVEMQMNESKETNSAQIAAKLHHNCYTYARCYRRLFYGV